MDAVRQNNPKREKQEYRQDPDEYRFIRNNRADAGNARSNVWLADWKKHGKPYCTVYIISPDNHWPCKIGISVAPRKRIIGLQTSVWRPLKVDRSFWCPTVADARALEKAVHKELTQDDKWLNGEWFDLRPDSAIDIIVFKAQVLGIEISDRIEEPEIIEEAEHFLQYYAGTAMFTRLRSHASYQDR